MTYEDYAALGVRPDRIFPVGGLYQEGLIRYPAQEEVLTPGDPHCAAPRPNSSTSSCAG